MRDDKDKQQSASFSLQNEIKKRRTQEIQRAIENKKIEQARSGDDPRRASQSIPTIPAPDPRRASQTLQSIDPRRASQTMNTPDPRRASQSIQSLDPRRASPTVNTSDPRRASQTLQSVDPRRASQTVNTADPRRASQTMKTADPRRASQTMQAVDQRRTSQTMQAVDPRRASQTIAIPVTGLRKRRQIMIVALAMLSILAVCVVTASVAFNRPVEAAVLPAIPHKSIDDVLGYLKQVGISIVNERSLAVDPQVWSATELKEVTVSHNGKSSIYLFLSYKYRELAIGDALYMRSGATKDWKAIVLGNILWVVRSGSDKDLGREVNSHLTSYIVAPFNDNLPTATPVATATPEGTAEAAN